MPTSNSSNRAVKESLSKYAEINREEAEVQEFLLHLINLTLNSFEKSNIHPYLIPDDNPLTYYFVSKNKGEMIIGVPYHIVSASFVGRKVPDQLDINSPKGIRTITRKSANLDFLDEQFQRAGTSQEIVSALEDNQFAVVILENPSGEEIQQSLLIKLGLDTAESQTLLEKLYEIQYEGRFFPKE